MPRHSIDYSKCLMYKIVCKDLSVKDLYVGHTTNWIQRKQVHKTSCNNDKIDVKIYVCMRQNGGWNNWEMILIEEFPCHNDLEASARERYLMESLNGNLNSNRPTITREEKKEFDRNYRKTHEKKIKEGYFKNYYEENKEAIRKQQSEKRLEQRVSCECGKIIWKYHMNIHILSKGHIDKVNLNIN